MKKIKPDEAALVYAKIMAHHSDAEITRDKAMMFYDEMKDYVTLDLALKAVKRFYADNHGGRWMMSGDVNYLAKRILHKRTPEQNEVENAMLNAVTGNDADNPMKYITAKRAYIEARQLGATVDQATVKARQEAAKVRAYIEPVKPKPPTNVRRFIRGQEKAGNMNLNDVLVDTHAK